MLLKYYSYLKNICQKTDVMQCKQNAEKKSK